MRSWSLAAVLAIAVGVSACGPNGPNKSDQGLVVGAVAGGILGNQVGKGSGKVLATALGVFAGGIVGSEVGRSMDQQDRILAQRAEIDAFERGRSGERVSWRNPDNGRYGEVTPGTSFRRGERDCRDFTHTVFIDGRQQAMRGTACRNPDGTWSNVS
jgi:surface antigen